MAAPVDSARFVTQETTGVTSHTIQVGSPASGTLLIVALRLNSADATITFTGYTQIASDTSDASNDQTVIYYRLADGTEGATDGLTTSGTCKITGVCWHVTGAANPATRAPEVSTVAVGTTTANTADPNSVAGTGGSKDYLFLAFAGQDGEVGAYTGAPTNYGNFQAANTGTGGAASTNCQVGGASRQLTAASDDPDAFTHAAAVTGWTAFTVVVHPAGATTHFGASAFTLAIAAVTAGVRTALGAASSILTIAATSAGRRVAVGASTGTVAFSATTTGTRTVFGASSASIVFTATSDGDIPTVGGYLLQEDGTSRFTLEDASGFLILEPTQVGGTTHFGSSTSTLVVAATSAGTREATGSSTATIAFSATTVGRLTSKGTSAASIVFTGTSSGTRTTRSASTSTLTFAATTAGKLSAFSSSTGTITFTATSNGDIEGEVSGSSSATLSVTATTSGTLDAFGRSSANIQVSSTTAATIDAFGASTATIVFTATTIGTGPSVITHPAGRPGFIGDYRRGHVRRQVEGRTAQTLAGRIS